MSNFKLNFQEANKITYDQQIMTSYEKVLSILRNVRSSLKTYDENQLADQITYVIQKIESNSLYSYNIEKEITNMEKDFEMKSIYDSLHEYSETKKKYVLATNIDRLGSAYRSPPTKKSSRENHVRFKTLQIKKKPISNSLFAGELMTIKDEDSNDDEQSIKEADAQQEEKEPPTKTKSSIIVNPDHIKKFTTTNISKPENDFSLKAQYNDKNIIKDVATSYFNIHEFYKEFGKDSFTLLSLCMFDYLELLAFIDTSKFVNFSEEVRQGYNQVPYHNDKHGVDVAHSVFTFINVGGNFEKIMKINKFDSMTLMVAALCHDIGHPGYNNNFQINSLSAYAVTYNDKSVLESFHAAEATKILLRAECNFLNNIEKMSFKRFRKYFVEAVLSTDMTFHAKINSIIKIKLTNNNIVNGSNIDKLIPEGEEMSESQQELFNFLLHTADISHNSRTFDISFIWVSALCEEFWIQGDTEKFMDLPISFLCDRDNTDVPKGQVGFLNYIIVPSFSILADIFPNLQFLCENVAANIDRWKKLNEDGESRIDTIKTLNHRVTSSIASLSSMNNPPALIFKTHFTSINFDGESISD